MASPDYYDGDSIVQWTDGKQYTVAGIVNGRLHELIPVGGGPIVHHIPISELKLISAPPPRPEPEWDPHDPYGDPRDPRNRRRAASTPPPPMQVTPDYHYRPGSVVIWKQNYKRYVVQGYSGDRYFLSPEDGSREQPGGSSGVPHNELNSEN